MGADGDRVLVTLLESVSRILDALWKQRVKPEGESILREAVGRLRPRDQFELARLLWQGKRAERRLGDELAQHVTDVISERIQKGLGEPEVRAMMEET
jgi:hypothetical protein